MTTLNAQISPLRRRIFRLLALVLALLLGTVVLECGLRLIGGYRLFTFALERRAVESALTDAGAATAHAASTGIDDSAANLVAIATKLASASGRDDLDPAWITQMPPLLPRGVVDAQMRTREEQHGNCAVHYVFNAVRVRAALAQPGGIEALLGGVRPDWLSTFEPDDGAAVPAYRFPTSTTLPDGLVLNRCGWRGADVSVERPPGVVRIACVGASTTVSNHDQAWSWTQILQHWLNLWAQKNNHPLRYEVLNLGREGITSDDIAAIVHTEALPFAPDYIIYMEGANQFAPNSVVQWEGADKYRGPPAGLLAAAGGVARDSALQRAASWSALARRLAGVSATATALTEPARPAQRFVLPTGMDENNPACELVRQHNTLGMGAILKDLDAIDAATRAVGAQLLLATFPWVVQAEMQLHPQRHAEIFNYLNSMCWPISYAHLRRAVDLQQAVFRNWAASRSVPLLDIAARMPREPDLFIDGIHDNQFGSVARAWCFLEALTPLLVTDGPQPRRLTPPPVPASLLQPAQRVQLH